MLVNTVEWVDQIRQCHGDSLSCEHVVLQSLMILDWWLTMEQGWLNTLRPRQNGRHFADDIFKRIFLNENILIPIQISLKFVPKGSINNIPALVQIMAWRRPGDKPLSEPMMVNLPTHICVTRPQWVKFTLLDQSWYSGFIYGVENAAPMCHVHNL